MGDVQERYEDNVNGKWYVDKKCILCSVCSKPRPVTSRNPPPAITTTSISNQSAMISAPVRRGHGRLPGRSHWQRRALRARFSPNDPSLSRRGLGFLQLRADPRKFPPLSLENLLNDPQIALAVFRGLQPEVRHAHAVRDLLLSMRNEEPCVDFLT